MPNSSSQMTDWRQLRLTMVDEQIRRRGVRDSAVLTAMSNIPREIFMPDDVRERAYEDHAVPIGLGQTISQPYIVAYMTAQLAVTPTCRVLEIGTGTGYQTAILASLCRHVFTVERIEALHQRAARTLSDLGLSNVTGHCGDGSLGWADHAPFDRIIVTAAAPYTPPPLIEQLADGGRLVAPIGGGHEQTLVCIDRRGPRTTETRSLGCRFVKLIGADAWQED